MLSDEQIVGMVRRGRVAVFRELVSRYQGRVMRVCRGILGNIEDAEDAAQETFLRAFQSLDQLGKTGSFWQWLRRIAIHICLRRLAGRRLVDDIDDHADAAAAPGDPVADEVLNRIRSEELWRMVEGLPHIYKTVLVLRYGEGLSVKEIAEAICEPVTTVHIRLHRAKTMLRQKMVAVEL